MNEDLFKPENNTNIFELVYDATDSIIPAEELGKAIQGMATILNVAAKAASIDFDDVYAFPIEKGSIRLPFKLGKEDGKIIFLGAAGNVLSTIVIGSFQLIGEQGMSIINTKRADIFSGIDPKIVSVCLNSEYKKAVDSVARPLSEHNRKLTVKMGDKGYEIVCEDQIKFLNNEKEPILPELHDGQEVKLEGVLTRMNLIPNNDLGFEYKKKRISLSPLNDDENISKYHGFLETPYVTVHGIVDRATTLDDPKIKVIDMEVTLPKETQIALFGKKESVLKKSVDNE